MSGYVLLWRRRAWGFVPAPMAGILGATYLTVLSVNSLVLVNLGFTDPPGEIVIWGPLAGVTAVFTLLLLRNRRSGQ